MFVFVGQTLAVVCANAYACILSVLTSLAMMGLFNVRYRLEDPFCCDSTKAGLYKLANPVYP